MPFAAHAQLDAKALQRAQQRGENTDIYGNNPFENNAEGEDDQDAEKPDTTKKERKIRKPLESYFFSDSIRALHNFQWTLSRDYNRVDVGPIDTTLANWHIDYPYYQRGLGDITLGGLGQSTLPVDALERPELTDFEFAHPYDAYTYNMENIPFYNVKKPFLLLTYLESGQKRYREEHFELTHAQNISPTTGFNVNYKARGTRGLYDRQRTKNHNVAVAFQHTGKRYSVHAAFFNNHIEQAENGGVVGPWAVRDTTFEMPSGVPMKLSRANAQNIYRNNGFFIEQSLAIPLQAVTPSDFSLADLSAVYIGHSFEYNAWSKFYTDVYATYTDDRSGRDPQTGEFIPKTDVYYKNWYISPERTRDSLYERVISNRFFVQAQPWDRNGVIGTLDGGVGIDMRTYSQFEPGGYMSGRMKNVKRTSWYAYGSVSGKIKRYVDWGAEMKYYPSGYRGGDYRIGAHIALTGFVRGKPLRLSGRFVQESISPSYWQESLYSNHYIWNNSFGKESSTRFEVRLEVPDYALELAAKQGVIRNKIYYDENAAAVQSTGTVSLTSIYARKDFRIGGLHLDNRVLLQWSTDAKVVPVPTVSAFLSYYYEFWAVRNVLRMQTGLDGRFTTKYYAPGYNPSLSSFYNQREVETGNYPYVDLFITGKWKRMRIILKYQHLNKGLFGNGEYFSAANYPLNPGMFKIGLSWGFYD
ncbi:MAG: putative porin [Alistipes sp.]|nr:putative porin [Alistipes sp.]